MTTRFSLPPPRTGFLQKLTQGVIGPARVWWRWFDNVHNTIDGGASGTLADLSNVPYALDQPHGPNTDVQLEQLRKQVNAIPNVAGQIADLKRMVFDLENLVSSTSGHTPLINIATTFGITGGPITGSGTISSTGALLNTQSGDYTVKNTDIGKFIVMTKATAATLTLTAANLTPGWWAVVIQALTGSTAANKVLTYTPSSGTFDGSAASYDYPGAQRLIEFDGTNFNSVLLKGGFLEVLSSDSPFTAPLPTVAGKHRFETLGAGGAGGSGRRGAAGTARTGGTGGGGGGYQARNVPGSYVTTSIVFTVPAGPTGGVAQTVDDTNGNAGSAAAANTTVSFSGGIYVSSGAGGPGTGGVAATALSGGAGGGTNAGAVGSTTVSQGGNPPIDIASATNGQQGGANGPVGLTGYLGAWGGGSGGGVTATSAATALNGGASAFGGAGGGSGGGISSANVARAGGTGAAGGGGGISNTAGGAAGTSGVAGGNGATAVAGPTALGHGAAGGGGGAGFDNTASGTASAGGAGSNGGVGCGGGGGGASLDGNNSGAGGNGGNGLARWWYT